jgi:hypothetical protein
VKTITVIDVLREMGIEITNELAWSLGAHVRERWTEKTGTAPALELTPKTHGRGGSHCLAHYPIDFKPEIMAIAKGYQIEKQRQGDLFA